jgi:hypothetical protein
MGKTLCEWSKSDLEKSAAKLARLVVEPRYFCRKCARVANRESVLCKPRKLPWPEDVEEEEGAEAEPASAGG